MSSSSAAIRLPFNFDLAPLVKEIESIPLSEFVELCSPRINAGSVLALHLIEPRQHDTSGNIDFIPTSRLASLPHLSALLNTFKSKKQTFRIHKLMPEGEIKTHRDVAMSYEHGLLRIHVPLQVNDESIFILNDEYLNMQPGECWYLDVDRVHRVENKGKAPRIHLVLDCERNEWWESIFSQTNQKLETTGKYDRMQTTELHAMKEQLTLMENEANQQIIAELDSEIKTRELAEEA